jgi:hypothetical protein
MKRSISAFMPFSWLKKTKSDQCMSQAFCCSCLPTGVKVSTSSSSLSFSRSSIAVSWSCCRMSAATRPQSAVVERSWWVESRR